MNTKVTSTLQSRQASVIPYSNSLLRNGRVSYETSSSLCSPLPKKMNSLTKNDSTDTFEMQLVTQQRKTLEAFHELEHLIPNGVPHQASFARMNSIIQDQDDTTVDTSTPNKSILSSDSNHS